MARIIVIDTETISIDRPYCYNVGYVIYDTLSTEYVVEKDFVVEQVWHNRPLFESAYYAEKRPLYVSAMRGKHTTMNKWGYIMREMANDIKKNNVELAYAYNSPFDDNVFTFNCDWFHTANPLDDIPILDIRGMVSEYITNTQRYKEFCEEYKLFTEHGNYSGTAEAVFRFITGNVDFEEAHTALADAEIETMILQECLDRGAVVGKEYAVSRSIPRVIEKPLKIVIDNKVIHEGSFVKKWSKEGYYRFTSLKGMEE